MRIPRANYRILDRNHIHGAVVLEDLGPWERHLTITNDAENVVRELVGRGQLPSSMRLLYYDSDGDLTEILVTDGAFAGFAPYEQQGRSA